MLQDLTKLGAWRFDHADTTSRVLLVGEDNPQSVDPKHALYCYPSGCAGNRLQEDILQMAASGYLALWRTNLCTPAWSLVAARKRASELLDTAAPWELVVMLGRKVTSVFDKVCGELEPTPPFSHHSWGRFTLVHIPHPSGRNLVWNSEANRSRARGIVSLLAPELTFGVET
jgi:hypothetical protein